MSSKADKNKAMSDFSSEGKLFSATLKVVFD